MDDRDANGDGADDGAETPLEGAQRELVEYADGFWKLATLGAPDADLLMHYCVLGARLERFLMARGPGHD